MRKYTTAISVIALSLLFAPHSEAASKIKHKQITKRVRKVSTVSKTVKKVKVASGRVLSANSISKPTGSLANPKPKIIQNVSAEPTLKFDDCTQSDFDAKFLCLINSYRLSKGKAALTTDPTLTAVALKYSAYMESANFFSHVAPDGTHYFERCAALGTTCHGENLAKGFNSAQNLFDMWRNSPSHNQNMLGPYTKIGLGISDKYATTEFQW